LTLYDKGRRPRRLPCFSYAQIFPVGLVPTLVFQFSCQLLPWPAVGNNGGILYIRSDRNASNRAIVSIDLAHPESITQTNLGVLASSTSGPVYALLSQMDLFQFYGLFLAALGLKKVGRISSGSAWTIVLAFFIIKVLGKVGWASMFG